MILFGWRCWKIWSRDLTRHKIVGYGLHGILSPPPRLQGRHMWVMVWDTLNNAWLVSNAMVPASLLCANKESSHLTVINIYITYGYDCLWAVQAVKVSDQQCGYLMQNNSFPGKVLTAGAGEGIGSLTLSFQLGESGDESQWWTFEPVQAEAFKSGYGVTVNEYHDLFTALIVGVGNYGYLDAGSQPGLKVPIAMSAKTDRDQQKWFFMRDKENGFYEIKNRKSFLNMTPQEYSMELNGVVVSGPGPDAGAVALSRLWRLIANPDGVSWRLANVYTGLYLRAADLTSGEKCQSCVMQSEIGSDIPPIEFNWWIHGYGVAVPPVTRSPHAE
jgi:hypothetical protein